MLRCSYSAYDCVNSGNGQTEYDDGSWDDRVHGYNRVGYGRGRGRRYPGRGRGGYGGQPDYPPETSGYAYNDEVPINNQGRGKFVNVKLEVERSFSNGTCVSFQAVVADKVQLEEGVIT